MHLIVNTKLTRQRAAKRLLSDRITLALSALALCLISIYSIAQG